MHIQPTPGGMPADLFENMLGIYFSNKELQTMRSVCRLWNNKVISAVNSSQHAAINNYVNFILQNILIENIQNEIRSTIPSERFQFSNLLVLREKCEETGEKILDVLAKVHSVYFLTFYNPVKRLPVTFKHFHTLHSIYKYFDQLAATNYHRWFLEPNLEENCVALAKHGHYRKAMTVLNNDRFPYQRKQATCLIIVRHLLDITMQKYEKAIEFADSLKSDPWNRNEILIEVVKEMARFGNLTKALETFFLFSEDETRLINACQFLTGKLTEEQFPIINRLVDGKNLFHLYYLITTIGKNQPLFFQSFVDKLKLTSDARQLFTLICAGVPSTQLARFYVTLPEGTVKVLAAIHFIQTLSAENSEIQVRKNLAFLKRYLTDFEPLLTKSNESGAQLIISIILEKFIKEGQDKEGIAFVKMTLYVREGHLWILFKNYMKEKNYLRAIEFVREAPARLFDNIHYDLKRIIFSYIPGNNLFVNPPDGPHIEGMEPMEL